MKFQVGDAVSKPKGYNFEPARIVSSFKNLKGEERYVAEISVGQCAGMLHIFSGEQLELVKDEIETWLDSVVHLDSDTKERRTVLLDQDRDRFFFFAEPLDFDKDDTPAARYWLDQFEGYKTEWKKELTQRYG